MFCPANSMTDVAGCAAAMPCVVPPDIVCIPNTKPDGGKPPAIDVRLVICVRLFEFTVHPVTEFAKAFVNVYIGDPFTVNNEPLAFAPDTTEIPFVPCIVTPPPRPGICDTTLVMYDDRLLVTLLTFVNELEL
jgi:hypothetical protein